MSSTQYTEPLANEPAERNPWSTEPELPPDPRVALNELSAATRTLIKELTVELDAVRPLLAVESTAQGDYVSAVRRLAAAEQTALDVNAALMRLRDGTYGFCTTCAEPIPPARLELRPHTRACVACS